MSTLAIEIRTGRKAPDDFCGAIMPPPTPTMRARTKWSQLSAAQASGLLRESSGVRRHRSRHSLPRGVEPVSRSAIGDMLSPSSESVVAAMWRIIQATACVTSILTYAISTVSGVGQAYALQVAQWVSSACLVLDYAFRGWTCHETRHFARLGAMQARLAWLVDPGALLRLLACYPSVSDGTADAQSVLLMLPRMFLIFRTSWWRNALRTARRVLFVNRQ